MRSSAVLLFAAALFAAGCATAPKPLNDGTMNAEELQDHLLRATISSRNFSAEGSITINSPSMNQSAGFELMTRGTDSVKMSVYGPFGITVGTALFTRRTFTAYNALNNTVYQGDPDRQMGALPFLKDIPFELMISALQGNHPLLQSAVMDSFTVQRGGSYSFTSAVNDTVYDKYRADENFLRITQCVRKTISGKTLWRVDYSYNRNAEGAVLPGQVEVSIPSKNSSLLLEYGSISFDSSSSGMTVNYPDDAEIITIE